MTTYWSPDELRRRASTLPRVSLAHLPTPLDELPRLSAALESKARLYAKREDQTGLGLGGNKVRKLEFVLGHAREQGCDALVHGLAAQSNYCRQTAAAAAQTGMPCLLILRKDHKSDDPPQGNRLLDFIFGAEVRMVEPQRQGEAKRLAVEELRERGLNPYLIGRFDEVLGAVAYSLCMVEITEQLNGEAPDFVAVTGGAGTQAGLVLGQRLLGLNTRVQGFRPSPADERSSREQCASIANEAARLLGADVTIREDEIENTSRYGGPSYGTPNGACLDALLLFGRTEGLVLGPVYTAKGFSGVMDRIRSGEIPEGSRVVFVHTGGTPEVFAYNNEIVEAMHI